MSKRLYIQEKCHECNGTGGTVDGSKCGFCFGKGYISVRKNIIPEITNPELSKEEARDILKAMTTLVKVLVEDDESEED